MIKKATLSIKGIRYEGIIQPTSPGITTMPVGTDSSKIFIMDFHAFRNIYSVTRTVANQNVTKVQQWGGIKFLDEDIKEFPVKTEKLLITFDKNLSLNSFKNNFGVLMVSYPSNLTLSLEGESPFWSYPGELTRKITVPDFSEKLKKYVDVCETKDYCTVPLIFRSDSPGDLNITENIMYNLLWDEFEQKKISFDGIETKEETVEINSSECTLQLFSLSFKYKGKFSDEFIDVHWSDIERKASVKISTGMSIGLRIKPSAALKASGMDLYLFKKSKDAMFFAEIVEDRSEKPAEEIVLASKNIDLSSQPSGHEGWVNIGFDEIIVLDKEKEKTYWLILKASIGEIEWLCSTSEDLKRRGCFIYKKEASNHWVPYPVTGYFRLKYLPEPKDLPINIKVIDKSMDLKPVEESQSEQINFSENTYVSVSSDGKAKIKLEITSKASAELELSDIVIEYTEIKDVES